MGSHRRKCLHTSQKIYCISVIRNRGGIYDAKRMQLISKRTFAYNKLGGIGPVQAVYAIGSCHSVLEFQTRRTVIAISKKASRYHYVLCYRLQGSDYILISASI